MLISKRLQKFKAYFQSFRMGSNEKGFFVQPPISVSVMSKQANSTYICIRYHLRIFSAVSTSNGSLIEW